MVGAAYDELVAAGFLEGVPGAGTRTTAGATAAAVAGLSSRPAEHHDRGVTTVSAAPSTPSRHAAAVNLSPGYPDTSLIDMRAWTRAWRTAASHQPTAVSPWEDTSESFTAALSTHLRTNRGIDTDVVFDVPGSAAAFRALASVSGLTRCYLESPCYPAAYEEFTRAGLQPVPVPVDENGLRIDELGSSAGLVYTTPAHQYPLGYRLSVNRRAELVAWAHRTGSIVIEDDYDGEFRYGVAPLPAIRSIPGAEDNVGYIGTASKILTPALGAAWLVPPLPLRDPVHTYLRDHRLALSAMTRDALTAFMVSGDLQRHLARAARVYRQRRDIVIAALDAHCPDLEVLGIEAGLHIAIPLPHDQDDHATVGQLAADGFLVEALSGHPHAAAGRISGLAVGFALVNSSIANRFALSLATILRG